MLRLLCRRLSLLAAGFILSAGCTTILGIDGHYVIGGGPAGGATTTPGDASGGSEGGAAPIATDAAVVAPPVDASQPRTCKAGSYAGTVSGTSAVLGAKLSGGTITFQLVRSTSDDNEFDIQKGSFSACEFSTGNGCSTVGAGTISATVTGMLACRAGKLTGQLNGTASLLNLGSFTIVPPSPFSGPASGDYDPSKSTFVGVWHEQGTSGGGTWTASPKGP